MKNDELEMEIQENGTMIETFNLLGLKSDLSEKDMVKFPIMGKDLYRYDPREENGKKWHEHLTISN